MESGSRHQWGDPNWQELQKEWKREEWEEVWGEIAPWRAPSHPHSRLEEAEWHRVLQ